MTSLSRDTANCGERDFWRNPQKPAQKQRSRTPQLKDPHLRHTQLVPLKNSCKYIVHTYAMKGTHTQNDMSCDTQVAIRLNIIFWSMTLAVLSEYAHTVDKQCFPIFLRF